MIFPKMKQDNRFSWRVCVLMGSVPFWFGCTQKSPPRVELPAAAEDGSPIVAMAGERPITFTMLKVVAVQNAYNLEDPKERVLALRDAVNTEILASEAKRLGYEQDPEIQRLVKAQAVQKLLHATLDAPDRKAPAPSQAELRAYYEANLSEFTPPTLGRGRVLALAKSQEENGAQGDYEKKLGEVTSAVQKTGGEKGFAKLIETHSDDAAARIQGGMTSWITKDQPNKRYPQVLIDALFDAADGQIMGPIETERWTYFVRREEYREGKPPRFEQVRSRIAQAMERQARLQAYDALVAGLKHQIPVETFPQAVTDALASDKAGASDGPPMGPVSVSVNTAPHPPLP